MISILLREERQDCDLCPRPRASRVAGVDSGYLYPTQFARFALSARTCAVLSDLNAYKMQHIDAPVRKLPQLVADALFMVGI